MQSPVKSSNEILSELFGAFNAKPPEITEPAPVETSVDKSSSDTDAKILDKDKKKSKHHKSKKSKKHSRHLSDCDHKKKKRKKKDEKHKRKSKHHKKKSKTKENLENSLSSSDSEKSDKSVTMIDISKVKVEKVADEKNVSKSVPLNQLPTETQTTQAIDLSDIEPPKGEPLKPFVQSVKKEEDDNCDGSQISANNDSVGTEKLDKIESDMENCNATSKVEDVFAEIEKPKPALGGKIMIKNLKFSSVFEETVKQVEEQARLKAERYEEGEISDSSSNLRSESKSSSPVPSVEFETVEKALSPVKSSHSKNSPSKREHRKRSKSSDKRKHKISGSHSSSHRSHKDRKSSSHRSRSGSRTLLKVKDPYPSKEKNSYPSKEKDAKKGTKRRRSSERSGSRHHHHSRHHSRKESDHHDNHRSSDDRHKDGSSKHSRKRSSSPSRKKPHKSRSRSRSKATSPRRKERRSSQEKIDKQKLLEIARKNALTMLKQTPPIVGSEPAKATIAAGGKTVDELTDFCKLLSKKDAEGHESISSNTTDSDASESEKPFHHPFQIKDRPSSIVLNIRNAVPMPLKTLQEKTAEQSKVLSQQFPVSSGQLHRKKESDWVPVSPKKDTENIPLPALPAPVPAPVPAPASTNKSSSPFVPPLPPLQPPPLPPESIFPVTKEVTEPTPQRIDVSTIMTQRLEAMRQLEKNPDDVHARNKMNKAELHMQAWAESKYEPGQFTGSTGARILTPYELAPGSQAWTRPDQLVTATPVKSGMGMTLLQKMGWKPGEGLGKNKEGALEPLLLKVKMDKKGLVAEEESEYTRMKRLSQVQPRVNSKSLEGKHPVSLLNEFCTKRRYGVPTFDLCFEGGPDHKKTFLYKVTVNGIEYKPSVSSLNKKQARVEAAVVCLKAMGVLEP